MYDSSQVLNKPLHPLKKYREEKDLTQSQLGFLLNVNGVVIAQIECGFKEFPYKMLPLLNEQLNIDADAFLEDMNQYRRKYKDFLLKRVS